MPVSRMAERPVRPASLPSTPASVMGASQKPVVDESTADM